MSLAGLSCAQVALALVVLKSTPPGSSVEDHILQIRSVIIDGSRKRPVNGQHYIDGTIFWKEAFEKLEAEKNNLYDQIFDLESRIESDRSALVTSSKAVNHEPAKRKTATANIQSKRRKIDSELPEDQSEINGDGNLQQLLPGLSSLLRVSQAVRAECGRHDPRLESIQRAVRIASHMMGQTLTNICNNTNNGLGIAVHIILEKFFRIFFKSWKILLDAISRMLELESKTYVRSIPGIVFVFQIMLGQIQQYCLDKADSQSKRRKKQPKSKPRSRDIIKDINIETKDTEKACRSLAEACCQMLSSLDLSHEHHYTLYEGLMCALLDHVGSSISLQVFAETGTPIQKQMGILPPVGLTDVSHIDSDSALLTCQLAAPFLIPILKRSVVVLYGWQNQQQNSPLGSRSLSDKQNHKLSDNLKQKLQSTLLRGIYGDEDETFDHALQRAAEIDQEDVTQVLKSFEEEQDKSEWFIGQVWDHIGWDILLAG